MLTAWDRLHGRAKEIEELKQHCLHIAGFLSGWFTFWNLSLIALGALVATQAAAGSVWGASNSAVSVFYAVLGVLIATASGVNALIRPGERGARFAELAVRCDSLLRDLELREAGLRRELDEQLPAEERAGRIDALTARVDRQLSSLRGRELELYLAGPFKTRRERATADR